MGEKGVGNPECSCKTWLWLCWAERWVLWRSGQAGVYTELKEYYTLPHIALLNWCFFASLPYNNEGYFLPSHIHMHTHKPAWTRSQIYHLGSLSNSLLEIKSQQERTLGHCQTPVPLSELSPMELKRSLLCQGIGFHQIWVPCSEPCLGKAAAPQPLWGRPLICKVSWGAAKSLYHCLFRCEWQCSCAIETSSNCFPCKPFAPRSSELWLSIAGYSLRTQGVDIPGFGTSPVLQDRQTKKPNSPTFVPQCTEIQLGAVVQVISLNLSTNSHS